MSIGELGCTYACLILSDDGIPVTAEKISTILKAANVNVESYWPSLFAKLAEKRSIDDLVMNVGAGGGGAAVAVTAQAATGGAAEAKAPVEEKKEEAKEESDDDMGFSLFD
ncbi:60S acidic ribosomal protein P1 [Heracleum sosnowskyi]|uniref:60S acidic ribosomal protein P1 n=1 Tax=Heracleum sosnowskyi TaxID=360622 RepID=A0AAD8I295_9APIA|nr:60S acidic ribosomal protein P1 [Heracleum sosnowskyi]